MSASLLRKGLDLLASDTSAKYSGKKKGSNSHQDVPLSSRKTGVRKQLKRMRRQGLQQKEKATAKDRVIKSALEEFKKKSTTDHLSKNMKYFLGSHNVANKDVVEKILTQNRGRKSRDQVVKQKKKTQQVKSVFSEKDFKRFEKEYFGKKLS
ncbi:active regulator of SIRT1 [Pelobates cultripes]|nr:active regulator of SIRT1 [Pelobates cultripes]